MVIQLTAIFAKDDASDDNDQESKSSNSDSKDKADKEKSKGWSFSISWGDKKKDGDEVTDKSANDKVENVDKNLDNKEDKKSFFSISWGKIEGEDDADKVIPTDKKEDVKNEAENKKDDLSDKLARNDDPIKKNDKTWLFQDAIQGEPLPQKDVNVKFEDILGIDEFKHEFEEIVDFLKNPSKYENAGARIPKGILLVGNPGCGKTLMAKALAGESNCSFFYKSGAEFEEVYVGVGARRMRDLFKAAKKHAPSIIFIDEIDSIAGRRGATA